MNYLWMLIFTGLIAVATYRAGYTMGKRVGFDLAVGYADDDHPPKRNF